MFSKKELIVLGIGLVLGLIVGHFWIWPLFSKSLDEWSFIIGLIDLGFIGIVFGLINKRSADKDAAEILRLNKLTLRALEEGGIVDLTYKDGEIAGIVVRGKVSAFTKGDVAANGTVE